MKKIVSLMLVVLLLTGCSDKKEKTQENDYSEYSFTDISWTREGGNDIETLKFKSDGSFSYYCSCGNPVNDSDLNQGYTYDDKTKTITVSYFEITEETICEIRIEACDGEYIKLNFDGEIREFVKEKD